MKRLKLLLLVAITLENYAQITHDFYETPLLEALQTINQEQTEYSIDILTDGLDGLQISTQVKNQTVLNAIRKICKGQPVKVTSQGKTITVQARRKLRDLQREIRLTGKVEDGFLQIPLPEARVSVLTKDSTVVVDSASMTRVYGANMRLIGAYYVALVNGGEKEYLVRAQMKGYDDVWQRVPITNLTKEEVTIPTLKMHRMRKVDLDEVLVTATRIKFFYRGDTLIYDATAFRMPEGSMLDDLIRQLPGVTMNNDGEIFVNGRKIDELLLGSRSFFGGNKKVLMQNLPYYTVKHLKVYEKQTDMSEALGYDVEPRKYVMDVNLKEEYSKGYIANVEAAAGTENRWLGRAFALRFTDRTRLTLLGNANNVNETRHIGESGHWTPNNMPRSIMTTHSAAAEIAYYAKGDKLKETLRAEFTSQTDEQTLRQRREQFLSSSTPTSLTESFSRQGNRRLSLHNTLSLKDPTWIYTDAVFEYVQRDGSSHSDFEQWDDSLTATLRSAGINEGITWRGQMNVQGAFNLGENQRVTFITIVEHNEEALQQSTAYKQTLFSQGQVTRNLYNADDISNRKTWGLANISYKRELGNRFNFHISDNLSYTSERNHDYLYHPDTLLLVSQLDALAAITDPHNSYNSYGQITQNSIGASLYRTDTYRYSDDNPFTIQYDRFKIGISAPVRQERLSYQRGALDTLASQTTLFLNASASFRIMTRDGKHDIRFNVSHDRQAASLMDRITFRDDSQPLVVKLGNPNLNGRVTSKLSGDFYPGYANQQRYHLSISFDYHHRNVAQAVTYAPVTGVYTYQPMNVCGAYTANTALNFIRTFGEKRFWTMSTSADASLHHDKDHAMLAGETESHVNTVNTLTLHDESFIQYERSTLNLRATGDFSWRHSEGRMFDFVVLNVLDYRYGLTARYTLPKINTTLAADATMYSRRGYGSTELNSDDFLLNASISQPFLKDRLIARLESFDLLHQLNTTQCMVNAQGRIETWYRSLPHYVMLHLIWHFNKNPKKK